jgi:hypothetical protein
VGSTRVLVSELPYIDAFTPHVVEGLQRKVSMLVLMAASGHAGACCTSTEDSEEIFLKSSPSYYSALR